MLICLWIMAKITHQYPDRFWIWLTTHTICIGWPSSMQFLSLPLLWAQKLHARNFCQWSLMQQKTGEVVEFSSLVLEDVSFPPPPFFFLLFKAWTAGLKVKFHRVPNIKFNVAKVLQSLTPIVDQSVSNQFFPPQINFVHWKYGDFKIQK